MGKAASHHEVTEHALYQYFLVNAYPPTSAYPPLPLNALCTTYMAYIHLRSFAKLASVSFLNNSGRCSLALPRMKILSRYLQERFSTTCLQTTAL